MGFYDRDYYRDERRPGGVGLSWPQTAVNRILLATVLAWLIDDFAFDGRLAGWLAATPAALLQPWYWWKFITYGFAHADTNHILFNMLGVWMFGQEIEAYYGRREFTWLYFALLAAGSIAWSLAKWIAVYSAGAPHVFLQTPLIGASAAVAGILVLFVLHAPHRTLLFMFVLPMPAWLVGVILVGLDLWGAMGRANPLVGRDNVAFGAHLAGAALAFIYFHQHWNFSSLPGRLKIWPFRARRPALRVHRADSDDIVREPDLNAEVDRILEKIHREGEASLTRQERQTLENASRKYQRRRSDDLP